LLPKLRHEMWRKQSYAIGQGFMKSAPEIFHSIIDLQAASFFSVISWEA